jgi:hypothetical protein
MYVNFIGNIVTTFTEVYVPIRKIIYILVNVIRHLKK